MKRVGCLIVALVAGLAIAIYFCSPVSGQEPQETNMQLIEGLRIQLLDSTREVSQLHDSARADQITLMRFMESWQMDGGLLDRLGRLYWSMIGLIMLFVAIWIYREIKTFWPKR